MGACWCGGAHLAAVPSKLLVVADGVTWRRQKCGVERRERRQRHQATWLRSVGSGNTGEGVSGGLVGNSGGRCRGALCPPGGRNSALGGGFRPLRTAAQRRLCTDATRGARSVGEGERREEEERGEERRGRRRGRVGRRCRACVVTPWQNDSDNERGEREREREREGQRRREGEREGGRKEKRGRKERRGRSEPRSVRRLSWLAPL